MQLGFKVIDILNDLGIEYKNAGPNNYRIKCLNPHHHETHPSMSIHKDTGQIYCFGCFLEDTKIITNTSIKKIKDINIGDFVLSHTGNFNLVTGTLEKEYKGKLLTFNISKLNIPFTCTPEHKFFIIRDKDIFSGRYKKGVDERSFKTQRILIKNSVPEEVCAENIKIGDWVYIPKIKLNEVQEEIKIDIDKYIKKRGKTPKTIPNEIQLTKELAWLIGLYVAEGSYLRGCLYNINSTTKKHIPNLIIKYVRNIFNIDCKIYNYNKNNQQSVLIPNVIIGRWLRDICGHTAVNKHLPYNFLSYNKEILQSLLDGYYAGDGNVVNSSNRHKITTISETLAYQIRLLLINLNYCPSLCYRKGYTGKTGVNHKDYYEIAWQSNNNKISNTIILEDKVLFRVLDKKETITTNTKVYDLEIEKDSSYLIYGFSVHNCHFSGNIFTLLSKSGFASNAIKPYLKKFLVGGDTVEERYNFLEDFIKLRGNDVSINSSIEIELPPHKLIKSFNYFLEKERGLTQEEIQKWNMGIIESGRNMGWIIIPIYQNNILRNYFLRNSFGSGKMYGPYSRQDILFGIDQMNDFEKPLYITEGIFDSIFVQRTRNQCVAALSNNLLPEQLKILKQYKKIVVVPDNDEQGDKLVTSVYQLIHHTKNLFVCKLPFNKKDAAMCSLEEILESTYKEIPIVQYILEKKHGITKRKII
jgi:intein/homing endonuclease/5S rRNA maturation endonuclease (ribonuclease M5)